MQGDMWVESEEGLGSAFRFTVWMGKSDKRDDTCIAPTSLSGKRILIAQGNETSLDILTQMLTTRGMHVLALTKGEDVIPALEKSADSGQAFDLCIMDGQMSGMDGDGMVRKIRESRHAFRDMPLVALSSATHRGPEGGVEAGYSGFLTKPVRKQKLLEEMVRLLASETDQKGLREAKEAAARQSAEDDATRQSVRILLAEDNPVNQKLAQLMLTKAGHRVTVANNGSEAVESYGRSPGDYDLIFMDVQMPEMDGIEATQTIRGDGFDAIPIIAMTAHAMKGDRERCIEAGMSDYVTKPIKRELVLEMIDKWVPEKG